MISIQIILPRCKQNQQQKKNEKIFDNFEQIEERVPNRGCFCTSGRLIEDDEQWGIRGKPNQDLDEELAEKGYGMQWLCYRLCSRSAWKKDLFCHLCLPRCRNCNIRDITTRISQGRSRMSGIITNIHFFSLRDFYNTKTIHKTIHTHIYITTYMCMRARVCLQRIACTSFDIFNMTAAIDFIFSLAFILPSSFHLFVLTIKSLHSWCKKKKRNQPVNI